MTDNEGYLLANRQAEAGERFGALAELLDPVTFRHLDAVGVGAGWHCWEVGAGGPSVPAWLVERVGPAGRVLATDIDTRWLAPPTGPGREPAAVAASAAPAASAAAAGSAMAGARSAGGFEVVRHDVGTEAPPAGPFDLVHARLVLVHVPRRREALAAMVSVLKPGGWLVVEDADPSLQPLLSPDETGPEQELANRLRRGFRTLMAERGADLAFGRTLPRLLRDAGLIDVRADGFFPMTSPGCTTLEAATIRQIRGRLVAAGIATDGEIDEHLANVATGRMDLATAPLISAWGRNGPA